MRYLDGILMTIVLGAFVFMLSACNTPGCLVQDKIADVSANFVASTLECEDVTGLKAAINDNVLSHTGLCKAYESGVKLGTLADTFCPTIADTVVDFAEAQGKEFLTKYRCKATNVTKLAKDKLTSLCKQIPLEPKP